MNQRQVDYPQPYVFFGTSDFAVLILQELLDSNYIPDLIITTPNMPAGRKKLLTPPPIKSFVFEKKLNIPVLQPEKLTAEFLSEVIRLNPKLFIVAAYGKILPERLLKIPTLGALNVHPSLLPLYRGPSPVQTAVLNGENTTGVTIMLVDKEMDHGPILAQEEYKIPEHISYVELHNMLAKIGAKLLLRAIPDFTQDQITPKFQEDAKATYTRILKKEDGKIDWHAKAVYIDRQVRALYPWPGTFTLFKGKVLKVLKSNILSRHGDPGKVFQTEDRKLAVFTGEDALVLEMIQLEGGKPMDSKEFALGHKDIINTILT